MLRPITSPLTVQQEFYQDLYWGILLKNFRTSDVSNRPQTFEVRGKIRNQSRLGFSATVMETRRQVIHNFKVWEKLQSVQKIHSRSVYNAASIWKFTGSPAPHTVSLGNQCSFMFNTRFPSESLKSGGVLGLACLRDQLPIKALGTQSLCFPGRQCFTHVVQHGKRKRILHVPNAPPISAPLVGMLTFTMPQSDPFGLRI